MKETFQTKVKVEDLSRSGLCVTAGTKALGFLVLYGSVVRLIMCIVGVYSKEKEVKDCGRSLVAWLKGFSGKQIIPAILPTDRRHTSLN